MKKTLFLILIASLFAKGLFAQCSPGYCDPFGSCYSYGMYFYSFAVTGSAGSISDTRTAAPCNGSGYLNRTSLSCTMMKGAVYTATVSEATANNVYCQAWIDFNNDNTYQSTETVGYTSTSFNGTTTFPLTIPSGTTVGTGTVKMRVAINWYAVGAAPPNMDPCVPCGGGFNYGEVREYMVTILNPPPTVNAGPSSLAFGGVTVGSTSAAQIFTVTGQYLTAGPLTVTAPTDFKVSTDNITYGSTATVSYTAPNLSVTPVYVKFNPSSYSSYTNSVTVTGGGLASAVNVLVTGTGVFACTGTPSIGSAAVSPTSGSSGTPFTLSIPPVLAGSITYQWQSYTPTSGSYFTNIAGATTASYTVSSLSATTYFRVIVTCSATGSSVTSNIATATVTGGTLCAGLPVPGTVNSDVITGCAPSYVANLYYTTTDPATGFAYQWQSSATSSTSGFTNISGATNPYYSPTVTTTKWYRVNVTCTASFGAAATTSQQLIFNPLPAAITGNRNVCSATPSTLSSATGGGTWTSSNPSIANAGLTTGVISAVSPGLATITYTAPTGCTVTTSVSVNNSPALITGVSSVCEGSSVVLSDISSGGSWSSSSSFASVGSSTGAVSGVTAGSAMISYTLPNGCSSVVPITINPVPLPITGTANVCVGSTTNLADATPGGTWTSSNAFQATAGSLSGVVSGVASGAPIIMYVLPTGCMASTPVTVNALPSAIMGSPSVCVGSTTTLSDAGGGTWSVSPTSIATVLAATGDVTGITGGVATVTYTLPGTGCSITAPMTVNRLPTVQNVTGGGGYCSGATTGVHIGLDGSESAVDYTLYTGGSAVTTLSGTSSGLDFGLFTAVGTYTVSATNTITSCSTDMAGSANVFINLPPNVDTMGGGGGYCAGGTGRHVTLSGSDLGVVYQLYNSGPVGIPVAGTGSILDFGLQTAGGFYTAVAFNTATGCSSNMYGTSHVIISPAPLVDTVGGGGGYCAGTTGSSVTLNNSTPGIDYYLIHTGSYVDTMAGTGTTLIFPPHTVTGLYTVVANDITNGCSSNMYGSATISVNLPPTIHNVSGGGSYCTGGTGVRINLDFSDIGVRYDLMNGSTPAGTAFGSNSSLNFGLTTTPGTYTVVATAIATGCTSNMLGSATVTANTPPTLYSVVAPLGSSYCAGGSGVDIQLSGGSDAGTMYQLYRGGLPVGSSVTGTGGTISFGLQTVAGNYTVSALNPLTGCAATMPGSVAVSVNALPVAYSVGGGGNYCTGGAGVPVTLVNSTSGIDYTLSLGATPVTSVTSTGGTVNFGLQAAAGVYTVMANDPATGCARIMNGNASVGILPLPAAYTVTGGGGYCAGGAGVHVGLAVSNTGITYLLQNSSGGVATLLGTGSSLDFGVQSTPDTYTVLATNTSTGCTNNMTGSVGVTINPLPTVFTVLGGGAFCAGGAGVHDSLSGSEPGVNYQQYIGTTPVGPSVPGTGLLLDFGAQTTGGTYTVKATNGTTGCTSTMASGAVISANPRPTVYTVSGGGSYCAGGLGVHINLSGSDLGGLQYQVWRNDTIPEGGFWAGTGLPLDLGAHTGSGVYKIVATDPVTGCTSSMADSATINAIPTVVPTINLTSSFGHGDSICAASRTVFTAVGTNGGTAPVYMWRVNGINVGSGSTYSYTPANNDNITITMVSNAICPSPDTVMNTHIITAVAAQTPAVTISSSAGTVICPGTSVTFTAAPVNGGTAPAYSWKKNGVSVASGPSYSYRPNDSDVIFATMNSNYFCLNTSFALSNPIAMHVNDPIFPSFTLETNPGTTVGLGRTATFIANVDNIGATAPTYQWKLNGTNIPGATNGSYSTSTLVTNDVVCVAVMGHNVCGASAPAEHCETMNVINNLGIKQVTAGEGIRVLPNPNKGAFTIKGSLGTQGDMDVTLEVTNVLGQVIYRNMVTTHNGIIDEQVQLNGSLANGMYLLNVRAGSDNKVFHFVIEQ
jgi:hypothetical protein